MQTIETSLRAYEHWLRTRLRRELVSADLMKKHKKMQDSAFSFFRATYWRFAEGIKMICPDLLDGPKSACSR